MWYGLLDKDTHPPNRLYFGDCLDVMRQEVPDESVDLYLDPGIPPSRASVCSGAAPAGGKTP